MSIVRQASSIVVETRCLEIRQEVDDERCEMHVEEGAKTRLAKPKIQDLTFNCTLDHILSFVL